MKTISRILIIVLLISSAFTATGCGGKKIDTELSISYLSKEDYLSGDYEGKKKEYIETEQDNKTYVVIDCSMSGLEKAKKKKDGAALTAEFQITFFASDKGEVDLRVEEFPIEQYDLKREYEFQSYLADLEIYDGIENEKDYRFVISVSKQSAAEITINASVTFSYIDSFGEDIAILGSTLRTSSSFGINDRSLTECKLEFEPSPDGSYYVVTGIGGESGNRVIVPETYNELPVKEIADNAFLNVSYVKEIILHEGVEIIGSSAFKGCTGLEWFTLPISVKTVEKDAFSGCTNAVIWCAITEKPEEFDEEFAGEGIKTVFDSGRFFKKNQDNTTYTFTFLDSEYPYDSLSIPETYLGNYVIGIEGDGTHEAISSLKTLKIPKKISNIAAYSFYNCTELTEIVYNANKSGTGGNAFANAGINSDGITVTFENDVKTIPAYLFSADKNKPELNPPNVKTVNIGKFVETVGSHAFEGCTTVTTVSIGSGTVGNGAFTGCSSLSSLTLGEDVTKIGNTAFRGCTSLKTVVIGKRVSSIGNYAFDGCTSLSSVEFKDESTWYTTKSSLNLDPNDGSTEISVNDMELNATNISTTFTDLHWFKK